jgi:hypothetical protein
MTDTNDNGDLDKLIERVKKLLAMAEHAGSNEHEAASAAEKAMALLAAHNMTMADVKKHAKAGEYGLFGQVPTGSHAWVRLVMNGCAKMYFCGYLYSTRKVPGTKTSTRDNHMFVGEKHNVVVAQLMSAYLVATVKRLATTGAKTVPAKEVGQYKATFCFMAALRLVRRMAERVEEASEKGIVSEGRNLYLQAQDRFAEWMLGQGIKSKSRELSMKNRAVHSQGASDGYKAGDSISLDPQVKQEQRERLAAAQYDAHVVDYWRHRGRKAA